MTEIKLPVASYFFNFSGQDYFLNSFSGSIGADGQLGCLDRTTISYKVIPSNKEKKTLAASIWTVPSWDNKTTPKIEDTKTFDFEGQKTVDEVQKWLTEFGEKNL